MPDLLKIQPNGENPLYFEEIWLISAILTAFGL